MKSAEFPQYVFVRPRSYTSGRKSGQPTVIIIHTTEGSEGKHSAEDGAAYDARRTDGVSAHFMIDQDTAVQEVLTTDEAHAARAHGNDVGIQLEVCGKAGQSATQWEDAASAGTIEQLAHLCVALRADRPGRFPLVNLTPAQLRAGHWGFAEHYDATLAWPEDHGDHSDPGPRFPWVKLFARIKQLEATVGVDLNATDANGSAVLGRSIVVKDGGTGFVTALEALRQAQVSKNRITELCTGVAGTVPPHMNGDGRSLYTRLDALEDTIATIAATVGNMWAVVAKLDADPTDAPPQGNIIVSNTRYAIAHPTD